MKVGLALLLVLVCGGCGVGNSRPGKGTATAKNDTLVSAASVVRAFSGVGLRRPQLFRAFEKGGVLGTDVREQYWDADASSLSPSIVVELFPTVRLARYAVEVGGDIETTKGVQIPPVPRVGNVVVTVYPGATQEERSRVLRALAILRKA